MKAYKNDGSYNVIKIKIENLIIYIYIYIKKEEKHFIAQALGNSVEIMMYDYENSWNCNICIVPSDRPPLWSH